MSGGRVQDTRRHRLLFLQSVGILDFLQIRSFLSLYCLRVVLNRTELRFVSISSSISGCGFQRVMLLEVRLKKCNKLPSRADTTEIGDGIE
jgi:hypothetical protein